MAALESAAGCFLHGDEVAYRKATMMFLQVPFDGANEVAQFIEFHDFDALGLGIFEFQQFFFDFADFAVLPVGDGLEVVAHIAM